jgi:hypothetical protein
MDQKQDDWLRTHWRPMMAYVYMAIVIFDFIIGPIFWSLIQLYGGVVSIPWNPLTLISGGIFHAAMGAVLGISAFSRGKEKIEALKTQYHDGDIDRRDDSLM